MIKKLRHGCITVSDLDRSLNFYRDILGLKTTMDFIVEGTEWDGLFQFEGVRFRIVYFEEGIELCYFLNSPEGDSGNTNLWDNGAIMLILEVSNLEEMYVDLVNKGVKFFSPPIAPQTKVPTVGTAQVAHLEGPDGERISLIEIKPLKS